MDRIELTGLRVIGTVGVLPEERMRAQPFDVDLVLEVDLTEPGRSDRLEHTVNYVTPIQAAHRVVTEEGHELLERVAARIIEETMADPRVEAVEVTIRKLRPPVPFDLASTAVRMRRTREQLDELRRPVVRAFLALGSNVGDRRATLVSALRSLPEAVRWSACYETEPIGGPGGQTPHLNAVVELATRLDPYALLAVCKRLERNAGRVRTVRNGPRTLDVDIVLYGDTVLDSPELTIPHPRMHERRFVLQPLSDLAPELCPPSWESTLPPAAVERVADLVLET